jgi:hypothetical protein
MYHEPSDIECAMYERTQMGFPVVGPLTRDQQQEENAYAKYHEDMEREYNLLQAWPRLDRRSAVAFNSECDVCEHLRPVLYGQEACTLGYPGHPGAEWTQFRVCLKCLKGGI